MTYKDLPHKKHPKKVPQLLHPPPLIDLPPDRPPPKRNPKKASQDTADKIKKKAKITRALIIFFIVIPSTPKCLATSG